MDVPVICRHIKRVYMHNNTSHIIRWTGIRTCSWLRFFQSKTGVQVNDNFKTCYSYDGSTKKLQMMSSKSCKAVKSVIKWYHSNFRFSFVSNLLPKPFFLTRGFDIFCSCHWLYLGTVYSFLSVCLKINVFLPYGKF